MYLLSLLNQYSSFQKSLSLSLSLSLHFLLWFFAIVNHLQALKSYMVSEP